MGVVRAGFLEKVGVSGDGWEREGDGCLRAVGEHKGGRYGKKSGRVSPREPVTNACRSPGHVPVLPCFLP